MTLFDHDPPSPPADPVRARLTVAYDGTGFRGFAAHEGVKTVGGSLARAIEQVLQHGVELSCAGRTDAGVHAWGQVVSFDAAGSRFDPPAFQRSLNRMLAPAIVVREAARAAPDFDARRSAQARSYRYTVLNRSLPDPSLARTVWHVEEPLDLVALRLACDPILGQHDFASFCRAPRDSRRPAPDRLVRKVVDARWHDLGDGLLRFDVRASSFCQQMVRSLVGTMVEMGTSRMRAGEMSSILRARNRAVAGSPAPPHGLCLWDVEY